jgi:NTP pyrophosphatase (non-canonical NTP hydrolase)
MRIDQWLSYYNFCRDKCKPLTGIRHLTHMQAGVISEVGEVMSLLKKNYIADRPLNQFTLADEWADVLWYLIQSRIMPSFPFDAIAVAVGLELNKEKDDKIIQAQQVLTAIEQIGKFLVKYNKYIERYVKGNYEGDARLLCSERDIVLAELILRWCFIGDMLNISTAYAVKTNIEKLSIRFEEKFTTEEALKQKDKEQ